jgi:O-antigen/teichoic acid export membrane protein
MARGGLVNLMGLIGAGGFGFLVVVVVTRGLHAERSGVFFEAVALFTILGGTAEFGADDGLTRMIPRYRTLGRTADLRRTIAAALIPVLVLGALAGAAMFAFAPALSRWLVHGRTVPRTALVPYLRILAPFVPASAVCGVMLAGTRGFGTMIPNALIANLGRPALRLLLVSLVVAAGAGSAGIAVAWSLPIALSLAVAWVSLTHLLRKAEGRDAGSGGGRPAGDLASELWRFAAPRGLSAAFGVAVFWLDTLLIGALLTTTQAGIYAATTRFLTVGFFALGPVQLVIGPLMSGLLAGGEERRARSVYKTATVWTMIPSWPIYLTMAVFAPFLLRAFGPGFQSGQTALLILCIAGLLGMTTGPCLTVLLMGGRSSWILAVSAASLTLNVVMNILLIPHLGIAGAAVAWAASIALSNLAGLALVRSTLRLSPLGPGVFAVGLAATICYGGIGLVVRLTLGASLPSFILFGVLATSAYALFLFRARDLLSLGELRRAIAARRAG